MEVLVWVDVTFVTAERRATTMTTSSSDLERSFDFEEEADMVNKTEVLNEGNG